MISATELVVAGLATWHIVEVWHHSSLFAGVRARVELMDVEGWRGKLREMLSCPFCFSVWVGIWTGCVVSAPVPEVADYGEGVVWLVVFLVGYVGGCAWNGLMKAMHIPDRFPGWQFWFWGAVSAGLLVLWVYLLWTPGWVLTIALLVAVAKLAVVGFAVARLANLGNDLTRSYCRTPRTNKLDHTGDGDDDTRPPAEDEKHDRPADVIPGSPHWGGTPGPAVYPPGSPPPV